MYLQNIVWRWELLKYKNSIKKQISNIEQINNKYNYIATHWEMFPTLRIKVFSNTYKENSLNGHQMYEMETCEFNELSQKVTQFVNIVD